MQNVLAHRMMSGLRVVSWTTQGPSCKTRSRGGRSGLTDDDWTVELILANVDTVMKDGPMRVSCRIMFRF
jgi:hypothetical protein